MKSGTKILQAIAAIGMMLLSPSALWAESQSPRGDPGLDFLGAYYYPQASGTKLSGTVAVIYDKTPDTACSLGSRINKMYVSVTMGQNANYAPFTTTHDGPFCMGTQEFAQAEAIVRLVRDKVIPFYFDCSAGCPGFLVKSVADYQYTTGDVGDRPLPADPNSGGFSATFTIAVN